MQAFVVFTHYFSMFDIVIKSCFSAHNYKVICIKNIVKLKEAIKNKIPAITVTVCFINCLICCLLLLLLS